MKHCKNWTQETFSKIEHNLLVSSQILYCTNFCYMCLTKSNCSTSTVSCPWIDGWTTKRAAVACREEIIALHKIVKKVHTCMKKIQFHKNGGNSNEQKN
jgi:hypothetical protein